MSLLALANAVSKIQKCKPVIQNLNQSYKTECVGYAEPNLSMINFRYFLCEIQS